MNRLSIVAIVGYSLLSGPASALLIRADRDDAEYVEMATRYPSAVALNAKGGEGVVIAPHWVLTSGAAARALQASKAPRRVEIAGHGYQLREAFAHPDAGADGESGVGLLLLRDAVRGIEPTPLCRGTDEAGKTVVIVGHSDRKKRAAINTVDRVAPRTLGLKIKALDEASDLQGTATASELGAPAFLETGPGMCVMGLLQAAGAEWQSYARVSAYADWIEASMVGAAMKDVDRLLDDTGR